jgi:hypothetical protein
MLLGHLALPEIAMGSGHVTLDLASLGPIANQKATPKPCPVPNNFKTSASQAMTG